MAAVKNRCHFYNSSDLVSLRLDLNHNTDRVMIRTTQGRRPGGETKSGKGRRERKREARLLFRVSPPEARERLRAAELRKGQSLKSYCFTFRHRRKCCTPHLCLLTQDDVSATATIKTGASKRMWPHY